jgi:hypothetical protein
MAEKEETSEIEYGSLEEILEKVTDSYELLRIQEILIEIADIRDKTGVDTTCTRTKDIHILIRTNRRDFGVTQDIFETHKMTCYDDTETAVKHHNS